MVRGFLTRLKRFVVTAAVGLLTLVEAPLFLLRNKAIFGNQIVYVFWHWSFGNSINGLDYASRLYYPNRISLIFILHPRSNPYLPHCFEHNLDIFHYRSIVPFRPGLEDRPRYRILRFLLLVLSGLTGRFHLLEHRNLYKTLSIAERELSRVAEGGDEVVVYPVDLTGYPRLLRDGIGRPPRLPRHLVESCRQAIEARHPDFFDRPFVTLALREKGRGSLSFFDAIRCTGPQENYIPAVRYLTQHGYHVVGECETSCSTFENIEGFCSLDGLDIDRELLNIFSLTNCRIFIGQLSGPFVLSSSAGVRVLLCDSIPFDFGTFDSDDLVLFKNLHDRETGAQISLVEAFTTRVELAYGVGFEKHNVEVRPNTPEEILEAVKETVAMVEGVLKLSDEDKALCAAFRRLPEEGMYLRYMDNRTTLQILRRYEKELLAHDPEPLRKLAG